MQARPQLRARRSAVVPSANVAPHRQHALAPRAISTKPSPTSHASTVCFSARTAVSRFNCTTRHFSTGAPAEASKYPEVDLFRSFIKTEGLAAAEAKLQTLIVDGKIPDANVFAVFLQEYARRGLAPQMASLSRAMGSAGVPLNRHGYNHFLSLHALEGNVPQMEETLKQMTEAGHARSGLTYKALFTGYVRARQLSKAVRSFEDMKVAGYKPDLLMHNELITAYTRANKATDAEQILLSMQRDGPRPNAVSYNIVMGHYGSRRLHAPLMALWTEMEAAKVPSDARTFTILIESLAQPQHWTQASRLIAEVTKRNIALDTPLVNVLIDAYGRGGHLDAMWRIYRGMRSSDLEPTAITFTSMANAHLAAGDVVGLRRVYALAQAAEVPLNVPFFTVILRAYSQTGTVEDWNGALAALKATKNLQWDAALCSVLASHFGKRTKNVSALRQLESDIKAMRVRVSPRLLAALVVAYAHAQDFPSAWRLYGSAKAAGTFDDGLHPPFIALLARAGRLEEMERAFGDVPRSRYAQLEALVGTMQKAYIAAGQAERSLALQERLRKALADLPRATTGAPPRKRA